VQRPRRIEARGAAGRNPAGQRCRRSQDHDRAGEGRGIARFEAEEKRCRKPARPQGDDAANENAGRYEDEVNKELSPEERARSYSGLYARALTKA